MFLIWTTFLWFVILKDAPKDDDALVAPLIQIKGFRWK
jgi:hypothetical protein